MKEKRAINLSKEELAQLKGGEMFAGNLPQMESTNPNISLFLDRNKNTAYQCKCDNKPTSLSNLNSHMGCVCNCTPK